MSNERILHHKFPMKRSLFNDEILGLINIQSINEFNVKIYDDGCYVVLITLVLD